MNLSGNDASIRLIFVLLLLILIFSRLSCYSCASVDFLDNFIDSSTEEIEKSIGNGVDKDAINKIMPGFDIKSTLKELIVGKFKYGSERILKIITSLFFKELINGFKMGVKIIAALFVISLIKLLKSSFGDTKVSQITFFCGYAVISIMLYTMLKEGMNITTDIVEKSNDFLLSSFPILTVLMTFSGAVASTVIIKPFYFFSVMILFSLVKNVVFPLILFRISIAFISNFSDKIDLKSISKLLEKITLWLMGSFLTVFAATLAIQGSLGSSIDNLTSKTAKFALGAFVPFAGKYISDASDTIIGATMLLKNSAGVLVMIIIVAMCSIPMIKILAFALFFKILTIISSFVSEKKYTDLLEEVSNIFMTQAGIIASIVFVFYVSICFIMGAVRFT